MTLQEPLPPFSFPNDQNNIKNLELRTPRPRADTTAVWAAEFTRDLKLKREQWNWKSELSYSDFESEVKGYDDELAPKSVCDTPFNYPRTEGDVA